MTHLIRANGSEGLVFDNRGRIFEFNSHEYLPQSQMKAYIVPTDFSDNSLNALNFALGIAGQVPRKIVLLSVVSVPSSSAGMLMSLKRKMLENAQDEMEALMRRLRAQYADSGKDFPAIEPVVVEGSPVETILDAAENYQAAAIVMGTRGASGIEGQLLGSNTSKVIEKAELPVLAVPGNAQFNGFGKVVYATESLASDDPSFSKLQDQLADFSVSFEVLHIQPLRNESQAAVYEEKAAAFKQAIGLANLAVNVIYHDDVQEAILEFVRNTHAGMLAMVTEERGFLRKVFDPSLTRKVALRAELPLLVFHNR